jgi:hypothetical protein
MAVKALYSLMNQDLSQVKVVFVPFQKEEKKLRVKDQGNG